MAIINFILMQVSLFCPNHFQNISQGYSINTVRHLCGAPDIETQKKQDPFIPQEWDYFITQSKVTKNITFSAPTFKIAIVFDANG